MLSYAGVDGCHAGWVAVQIDAKGRFSAAQVWSRFADVITATAAATLVLVDVPIGLPDSPLDPTAESLAPVPHPERSCDLAARKLLRRRGSSIFPVPSRAAVYAGSYEEASKLNHLLTGRRLSRQSWEITRKIAQADLVLRHNPSLQSRIRESHPELCFLALNGWHPLQHTKKQRDGLEERLTILEHHSANARAVAEDAWARYPRSDLARDDVADAMACAAVARLCAETGVRPLPDIPELDALGLRMEIVLPAVRRLHRTGVRHVMATIYVADMTRSLNFYRDLLGLRIRLQWPATESEPEFVVLGVGHTQIGLTVYGVARSLLPGQSVGPGPAGCEVTIGVSNVDEIFTHLRLHGVKILAEPLNQPWGERTGFCQDADGHPIRLYSPSSSDND